MADASIKARFLNPWVLHHQKLGLELKCPLCLNLLNRPMLLPCNHIFCDFCVPKSTQFGSDCPVCKQQYADRDVRPAPYMENLVSIYRSLDATFCASLFQPLTSDAGRVAQQSPALVNTNIDSGSNTSEETPQERISSNGKRVISLTNKRVQASLSHSVEGGGKLIGKSDKPSLPVTCESDKLRTPGIDILLHPRYPGWKSDTKHGELDREEVDINQNIQPSPSSPPSSDTKMTDDNSSEPGSHHDFAEKHLSKRLVENSCCESGNEKAGILVVSEDQDRDVKRQKKWNYGLFGTGDKSNGSNQPNDFCTGFMSTSKLESEFQVLSGVKVPGICGSNDTTTSICAFCQTSGVTEKTGPMMHYLNGKEVMPDAATHSKAIPVHKLCVEWTPQTYFVGDMVKNLKAEVARAAKLKCSTCNLRGASLGCFVQSCRKSYHVPCAIGISGCRWDFEDFLMLCPSHSSVKFPSEKSKFVNCAKQKQHFVPHDIKCRTSEQSNFWGASPDGKKEWVFCGSALSSKEKYLLAKFASICGASVSKFWKPNVTHVIASTDEKGAFSRTLKVLKAILNGRWVLKIDWIEACMQAMHPVDEEAYEVSLDNHGCREGPKTGRLRVLDKAPKLFNGLNFFFTGDFVQAYKEDLLDLVISAGGTVLQSKEELVAQTTGSVTLVVYNNDVIQESRIKAGDSTVLQRQEVAEKLGGETGAQVIAQTWLLESIAACKLQPFGLE
ncbi:Histone-lysine N-methyltransferase [Bertholletia excelsa]